MGWKPPTLVGCELQRLDLSSYLVLDPVYVRIYLTAKLRVAQQQLGQTIFHAL